jgi:HD superfamily phosphohydrolase YqeK
MKKNDIQKFVLQPNYFDFESKYHGINHTYRVMFNCIVLGNTLRLEKETKLAFCAAFIHDMARKNDGFCNQHGQWAIETKLPRFKELILSIGVKADELNEIETAVIHHCKSNELSKENPFYKTTAILKDADALDRVRFNEPVKHLRFKESIDLIGFAEKLYSKTNTRFDNSIDAFYDVAKNISPISFSGQSILNKWFQRLKPSH